MSNLKTKSDLSLVAAEFLNAHSHYSSVIHCAYYSCFQHMRYTWLDVLGNSEQDLRNLRKGTNQGTHEVLINQIKKHVNSKSEDDVTFNKMILELKRLRMKADYSNKLIDKAISDESIKLSKSLLKILENCI
jgi:uncharacterized protein (UPF0332 family)